MQIGEEKEEEEEEESGSEDDEENPDEIDYELDKVLINAKNSSKLAASLHFPISTQVKLVNLTRREVLASWLSFTQLNELVKIFGFKYKRGRFSTAEKEEIEDMLKNFCKANSLTVLNFMNLSRTKSRRGRGSEINQNGANSNSLIPSISSKLEGRPNISIWQYMRRAYNPKSKLGAWTEEEEEALQAAVKKHGSKWTIISDQVGRSADDCKDRWRNYTLVKGSKNSGGWSKEEEKKLIELMSKSEAMVGSSKNPVDGFWTWVSEQMGGSRSRAQCRIKWVENLKPKLDSEAPWTNRDVLTLAQQLKKYNLEDEVGFDWKQVRFGKWSAAHLQRRWKQVKKFVIKKRRSIGNDSIDPQMDNKQVLELVLERWANKPQDFLDTKVRFAKSSWLVRSDEN